MAETLTKYFPEDGDHEEELFQDDNQLRLEKRSDDEQRTKFDINYDKTSFFNLKCLYFHIHFKFTNYDLLTTNIKMMGDDDYIHNVYDINER